MPTFKKHAHHVTAYKLARLKECRGFDKYNRTSALFDDTTGDYNTRNCDLTGLSEDVIAVLDSPVEPDKSHAEAELSSDGYLAAINTLDLNEGKATNLFEAMALGHQQQVSNLKHWVTAKIESNLYSTRVDSEAMARRDLKLKRAKRVLAANSFVGSMGVLKSVALDKEGRLRPQHVIDTRYANLRNPDVKPARLTAAMRRMLAAK